MNVFYEEEGALKVGAVLADHTASLQVEAPHGKRSKIKAGAVLFRFDDHPISDFMQSAQKLADEIDLDFLWQCSSGEEFDYADLAREYYGRTPTSVEAAAVLYKLHSAPMYFYKRGRGRYKAAPEEALKAALASIERKKQQAIRKDTYVEQLTSGTLPPDFEPMINALLYKPDRNSIEWKALEEASAVLKLTPIRVIERCGGLASTHDYHLNRFLFEHFPRGAAFPDHGGIDVPGELPVADVEAFSIDDTSTTEIDDAFSLTPLPNGNVRVGIHIAAPALGVTPETILDEIARARLSTVYFPGGKITMLPPSAIERYTLAADSTCPALSLYTELNAANDVVSTETRVERVRVGANLRHEALEPVFNTSTLAAGVVAHERGPDLVRLWAWAVRLGISRRGDAPEGDQRPEYNFRIENDRVQITRRQRGTPIDLVVSELMIYLNSVWGSHLAEREAGAIYRVQGGGKVRMSTVPAAHASLGVEQYAWASSPLRRYVDLVNQRQLIALTREDEPPYRANDPTLPAIMREFESAYDAYSEFQRAMERYWCLRWLLQEKVEIVEATVLRENLCRFDELPLVARIASLPQIAPGSRVALQITNIDLIELIFHAEFRRELIEPAVQCANGSEALPQ